MSDLSMIPSWDEVAASYGRGDSPFGQFPQRLATWAGIEPGDRVLDLGCGNGLGLEALGEVAPRSPVVGVDFSPAMLAESARRMAAAGGRAGLVRADVMALPFPAGLFDVALASSVFQFVAYSLDALREWRRVLAPGGRLALSIPGARDGDAPDVNLTLLREFFGRLPAETQRRFRERPVPGRPPDLADACRAAGFESVTVEDVDVVTTVTSREAWLMRWTHGFRGFLREFDAAALDDMRARAFQLLEPRCGPDGEVAGRQLIWLCRAEG